MKHIARQMVTRGVGGLKEKGPAGVSGDSFPAERGAGTSAAGHLGDTRDTGVSGAGGLGLG